MPAAPSRPPAGPAERPRRAPTPIGPLSGRRGWLRRLSSFVGAQLNRGLDLMPPVRWLHRHVQGQLEFTDVRHPLRPGHEALHGLRIAFLSDLHAGSYMTEADLVRIFTAVAAREPHLVLLGGDLINTRERELLLYRRPLQLLRPPLGTFAVPGNHDHFWGRDIGLWTSFLREQDVGVLVNAGVRLQWNGSSLWLGGVDDLTEGEPDLRRALAGRRDGETTLLLSHHPDFFFESAAADVDLQLSGHTHGGQIRIAGIAPIHHSRFGYERGSFVEAGSRLYVGRGVGVTLLPLRIDARAEVPMVTLHRDPGPST